MKSLQRSFLLLVLLAGYITAVAQPAQYGNEWIDHSLTYYKFKVEDDGIYRIRKSALNAAGVPGATNGDQFMLFRDGVEVPIFTTTNSSFGTNDYIEFFGRKANGKLDRLLFKNSAWQSDDRISLFSDTACYYLSYNSQTSHLRYAQSTNPIPPSPPPALDYCLFTTGSYFKNKFLGGKNNASNQFFPSSAFDIGEGFVDQIFGYVVASYALSTPHAVTTGPNANVSFSILRNCFNNTTQHFKVTLNNQQIADSVLQPYDTKQFRLSVPSSILTSNNTFGFEPVILGAGYDEYGISFLEIKYARDFDVNGLDYFLFDLAPSSSAQYIEFAAFNNGGDPPRLYDVTNRKWYEGDLSISGKSRFYIDPSASERNLVLYASNSLAIHNINSVKTIQFTNYSQPANQGNYIILTHKDLTKNTNGHNYIQDYKDYRNSVSGGSHQVVVAEAGDLYDQFAYGNETHPLSMVNFAQYAYYNWTTKPEDFFIIGRGLQYAKYKNYLQNPSQYDFSLVPTYGDPGSDVDFVNFGAGNTQKMNAGRLSAWNPQEVAVYLDKVKAYEAALKIDVQPTAATELWKKRVLHIAGSGELQLQHDWLLPTLNFGAVILEDTFMGAFVTTIAKNTTDPVDLVNSKSVDSMINDGVSILTFHGHASASGFDFNLDDPTKYHSSPRFPTFLGLGCDVSQIFSLTNKKTISENYIDAPTGGSIIMLAADNLGYVDFHRNYLVAFYSGIARTNYGGSIGDQYRHAYDSLMKTNNTPYMYTHLESMILQGDPAIHIFAAPKPDYHIGADGLSSIPGNVTTTLDSFRLKVIAYNLARAVNDTVRVKVEHTNPAGVTIAVSTYNIVNLFNTDTSAVSVPINKLADLGLNKYKVTIDDDGRFDETSETNNSATLELFIYSDNLVPIYPYEFSIVNQQNVELKASTLNPFRTSGQYKLQIDTTELFNSPLKQQTVSLSAGGVLKWTPSITLHDSTVYYWRTAFDSTVNGVYQWSGSSFIYLANSSPGWNQSHYFQYKKNTFTKLDLGTNRQFNFPFITNTLTVTNAVLSDGATTPYTVEDSKVMFNGIDRQRFGCYPYGGTIQIMVLDSVTNEFWKNSPTGTSGAYPPCLTNRDIYAFEFSLTTPASRNNAKKFLDSIPNGNYVLLRNAIYEVMFTPTYVDVWKTDAAIYGAGQTLYHAIHNMGFTQIDSFNKERAFIFMRKKGSNTYPVYQSVAVDKFEKLEKTFNLEAYTFDGTMHSTVIGPAKKWNNLKWKTTSDNIPLSDSPIVKIIGITPTKTETELYSGAVTDKPLAFIDAVQYPNIRLEWRSYDSIARTSPQLNYWRVLYSPVPEAALNPAAEFSFTDSLQAGQMQNFSVAVENLTPIPMDSMLVRYKIIDASGVTHTIANKRYKALSGNDTLHADLTFDPAPYPGTNVFFIEANPNNDQPEQYHPNNLGYIPFNVITDERNPLVDVTFDGVHILERDIVSAKPFIKIALRDENQYLKLDDTGLISVSIRYPDDDPSVRRTIPFDGTICRFIPAKANGKNEAYVEYRPTFEQDGFYQLYVNGRDKAGNVAAKTDYQVLFEVINKSSITNILNYPNPFSTSTAFLFTITGYQIPSQFKIQIMTVTGKVVREITKNELGPIHIGRNITEYKWDGKDQYGQTLGNGVYMYRVVTSILGSGIEHRDSGADKFYKKGYGKMYIMR
jgi:hypothetical protein